jgi:hypothetical protein
MSKSAFLRINWRDVLRGIIVSLASTLFTTLKIAFDAHGFDLTLTDVKMISIACISSFCGYLSINLFTNSQGQFKPETK